MTKLKLKVGNLAACIFVTAVEGILYGRTNATCKDPTQTGYGNQKPLVFVSQGGAPGTEASTDV